ncbi:C4-dicarboxylate TRAP transporter large permease protein DctM [subsurface metagenome]
MSLALIALLSFGVLLLSFASGLPLCFGLGGVAMLIGLVFFGPESMFLVTQAAYGTMLSFVLMAIPLFIFMGSLLSESGIADDLYSAMYHWMGPVRGGLAIGTVLICTVMAAMCGVVAAGVVTMGIIAIPSMLKRKYRTELITGSIMAGGSLGALIPPSIVMMIYGLISRQSVGKLFMGGVFPGFILSFFYCSYIAIRSYLQPQIAPALPPEERGSLREKFIGLRAVILPILIIISVLGSIFLGIATPTEAAGVGCVAVMVAAAIHRRLTWAVLRKAAYYTFSLSGMVMWVVLGASVFSRVFFAVGGADLLLGLLALEVNRWVIMIAMQVSLILMGMVMDDVAMLMIAGPIYTPIIIDLGFDPIWFGILFIVNLQIAYLTPPFGYALFYMRGVAPEGITMGQIYRSIIPFVILQIIGLILVMVFPQLALWLPSLMLGAAAPAW